MNRIYQKTIILLIIFAFIGTFVLPEACYARQDYHNNKQQNRQEQGIGLQQNIGQMFKKTTEATDEPELEDPSTIPLTTNFDMGQTDPAQKLTLETLRGVFSETQQLQNFTEQMGFKKNEQVNVSYKQKTPTGKQLTFTSSSNPNIVGLQPETGVITKTSKGKSAALETQPQVVGIVGSTNPENMLQKIITGVNGAFSESGNIYQTTNNPDELLVISNNGVATLIPVFPANSLVTEQLETQPSSTQFAEKRFVEKNKDFILNKAETALQDPKTASRYAKIVAKTIKDDPKALAHVIGIVKSANPVAQGKIKRALQEIKTHNPVAQTIWKNIV